MTIPIDDGQIARLVDEVVRRLQDRVPTTPTAPATASTAAPASRAAATPEEGVFETIDEAVRAATTAYREFSLVSLYHRKHFLEAMRQTAIDQAESLAREMARETGLGRVTDKVQKVLFAARKTPGIEDLIPVAYTGDDGLTLVEPAPYGVIGAITPTTNAAETVICNSIGALAAGNAVVFNCHPGAAGVSNRTVRLLNKAIRGAGGPATLLCSVARPTLETSAGLMKHPGIRMLMVTGGGEVVRMAMASGKKCIAAGPGNPPVIVDDTANLAKAAKHIVDGASFDNNILCTAEKEVFVFENVADRLLAEMQGHGAFLASPEQLRRLTELVVEPGEPFPHPNGKYPHPNKKFVGQDAAALLKAIGVEAPRQVRLVVGETTFDHPLVQAEMLMPVLPVVRAKDLDEALSLAIRAEHGYRHSAMMHSESVSNMSRVAREIETTIFVKNAPSYAGLGFGGEGFGTYSIAGPTGEGLTSPRSFTRQRRCVLAGAFRIV
ncbi:MAG: aldehyde dehydrogenase EutE [Deltaproteobacteria bacterium]|nr:aldehyde dehydrogenase EutE [Deltaproteobacteria bacterium]